VIAYPTTSSQFAPLWFARDVGLYEKYGLDGQLVFIQGGSILLQAILAGKSMRRKTASPKQWSRCYAAAT
jgi:ABC-type nitrate/sulfonate/bicarbonate transport system substrate-binding protein